MATGMAAVEQAILSTAWKELQYAPSAFWKAFAAGLSLHLDRLYGKDSPSLVEIAGPTEKDCRCAPIIEGWISQDQVMSLGSICSYHALLRSEG